MIRIFRVGTASGWIQTVQISTKLLYVYCVRCNEQRRWPAKNRAYWLPGWVIHQAQSSGRTSNKYRRLWSKQTPTDILQIIVLIHFINGRTGFHFANRVYNTIL